MGYRLERYRFLLAQGNAAVFTYDYPGYGRSCGAPSQDSVLAAATAATDFFAGWVSNDTSGSSGRFGSAALPLPVPPATSSAAVAALVQLGRSLGGSVATANGRRRGWVANRLILQSGFSDPADLARYYFPMFGGVLVPSARSQFGEFDSVANLDAGFRGCFYHSHSRADRWVPLWMAERLEAAVAARAAAACSVWVVDPSAQHTQPLTLAERAALAAWIAANR